MTRRMSGPKTSRAHLRLCLSRRLSRGSALCGNSALFFQNAMPEVFFGILLISRRKFLRIVCQRAHSPKYCGSSRAQAFMSALSDHIKMSRGAQGINISALSSTYHFRAQTHKHNPAKRDPRGCLLGHPRIWDL